MSQLIPIEPLVDPILKKISQKSLDRISSILIALRRIRHTWGKYFDDFLSFAYSSRFLEGLP